MRWLTVGSMYPPHHLGGYELMWRSWVESARRAGDDVLVLASDFRRPGVDDETEEGVRRTLRWYWSEGEFPRLSIGERRELELADQAELAAAITEHCPDAVCWWALGGMPLSLAEAVRRAGIPAAFVVVDEWPGYAFKVDGWQRAFGRPGLRWVGERLGVPTRLRLAEAGRWVFVSDYIRRRTRAVGIDPESSEVAHAGIDPAKFPRSPAPEWRGHLVCVGRVEPRKGAMVAVRALPELDGMTLAVVGPDEGGHVAELRAEADRLGVGDRVSFRQASHDEVARTYADADAALFCVQWEEPFGLVPLEAMAVGRPVVASATGGSAEFLDDGQNCLVYSPRNDPSALAAAVRRLAGDRALRDRLVDGGLRCVTEHHEERFNAAVTAALAGEAGEAGD